MLDSLYQLDGINELIINIMFNKDNHKFTFKSAKYKKAKFLFV